MSPTVAHLISTVVYAGHFPKGPGTIGALVALAIAYIMQDSFGAAWTFLAGMTLLVSPLAMWAATITARELGHGDPGCIVIDEVVGQWLTLIGATAFTPVAWILGFVFFRLFDIWKPWPIRRFEHLTPAGVGIVADDLMAGLYGAAALQLCGQLGLY
ncbi:MAG: phosphatidylglycerophosphatase A [Bryobacteraceae bacterium]|nr:phosphatidylglycerophosphatase A [Bryobacteraceae bacterium]